MAEIDKTKFLPPLSGAFSEEIQAKANTGEIITCPHEPFLNVHKGCTNYCDRCAIKRDGGLYDSMGFIP